MENNNKLKFWLIIPVCAIVLLLGGTYAWYVWQTSQDEETIIATDTGYAKVFFDGGSDVNGKLKPVSDKSKGMSKEITVVADKAFIEPISFNLYLDINSIDENLKHESFKFELYKDDTLVKAGNFGTDYLTSALSNCEKNTGASHITLTNDVVTTTESVYTLYTWIDGNMSNPIGMEGKNFGFTLHADGQHAILGENNNNVISDFDFRWNTGTIDNMGVVSNNSSSLLNNYYTPITYFENLQLNILTDNVMFKIVEYDKDGNFISSSSWQSKEKNQWSDGGIESISIEDKYIRIAICDTTINNSGSYTMGSEEYSSRYSYVINGEAYYIGIGQELYLSAIDTITLPNVKYGEDGLGFTITGLTYSSCDNTYYAGNYGKVYTSDTTINNTIVHLSSDLKTNLGEIELNNIYSDLSDIQGVTIDSSDDTIWFVSQSNGKIYHITKNGEDLGSVSFGVNPSGIAYDSRTDSLWILQGNTLKNIEKTGTINSTISISNVTEPDQIYLDEKSNTIYFTAGSNYYGYNYVYKVDLSTQEYELLYALKDSYAIEGIYIKDDKMYIANDGVYHDAKIKSNIIQVYEID